MGVHARRALFFRLLCSVPLCSLYSLKPQPNMARNIEIKARIDSVEAMAPKAAALADQGPIELHQDDTFFACQQGRLKLRAFSATAGQLIFYQRPNQLGPKESFVLPRFHLPHRRHASGELGSSAGVPIRCNDHARPCLSIEARQKPPLYI